MRSEKQKMQQTAGLDLQTLDAGYIGILGEILAMIEMARYS